MDGIGERSGVLQAMKKRERGLDLGVGVGVAVEICFKKGGIWSPKALGVRQRPDRGGVEP